MRIDGEWYLCDDGVVRPIIRGEVLNVNGFWEPVLFLVDTGADRTVFSAAILDVLGFQALEKVEKLGGIGGIAVSVAVKAQIRLPCNDDRKAVFRGEYVAFADLESLEISVLGRDLTEMFGVIVDRRAEVVCLLAQRHRYFIEES